MKFNWRKLGCKLVEKYQKYIYEYGVGKVFFFFWGSIWKLTTCYNSHLIYFFGRLCLHWWSEMMQLIGLTWNCIGDDTSIEQAKKIV
jgi:hypothetical protein